MSTSTDTPIALDPGALRADFPILSRLVDGHPLVYLDSAATSQKPRAVIDAEVAFLTTENAAVHRGAHTLAAEATELFEDARATVAGFVGAAPEQLVWTSGATAGLNLVAYAIGNATLGRGAPASARFALAPGDEIVVTESEHHANLVPWQELAARTGAVLRHIRVHEDGQLDLDAAASVIGERTRVVAFPHVSNVLGIVNPVEASSPSLARWAPSPCWTRASPRRTCRSTCRPSTSTWPSSRGTRCSGRTASAASTAARTCSRRCRRS